MTQRVTFHLDDEKQTPGSWYTAGAGHVFIRCPLCRRSAILRDPPTAPMRADGTHGHTIAADGSVAPSIVCPHTDDAGVKCTFHVWGRLLDWPWAGNA